MTAKTRLGVAARVDDVFGVTAEFDVFASGAMTGFAAGAACQFRSFDEKPRMRAGQKFPADLLVAFHASLVADIMRTGNGQWRHDRVGRRGTRLRHRDSERRRRSPRHPPAPMFYGHI